MPTQNTTPKPSAAAEAAQPLDLSPIAKAISEKARHKTAMEWNELEATIAGWFRTHSDGWYVPKLARSDAYSGGLYIAGGNMTGTQCSLINSAMTVLAAEWKKARAADWEKRMSAELIGKLDVFNSLGSLTE